MRWLVAVPWPCMHVTCSCACRFQAELHHSLSTVCISLPHTRKPACLQGPDLHTLAALHALRSSEWSSAQRLHTSLAGHAAAAQPDGAHLLRKAKLAALAQEPDSLLPSQSQVSLLQSCAQQGLPDCCITPGRSAVGTLGSLTHCHHCGRLGSRGWPPASLEGSCRHQKALAAQDVEALEAQLQLCAVQEQLGLGAAPVMDPQRLGQAALAPEAAPAAALLAFDVLGLAGPAFRASHAYAPPCAAGLRLAWLHPCSPVCRNSQMQPLCLLKRGSRQHSQRKQQGEVTMTGTRPALSILCLAGQALCTAHQHAWSGAAGYQHVKSCCMLTPKPDSGKQRAQTLPAHGSELD